MVPHVGKIASIMAAFLSTLGQQSQLLAVVAAVMDDEEDFAPDMVEDTPPGKRSRRVYPRAKYRESAWWQMLQADGLKDHTTKEARLFRRRFRVPYAFFVDLVALVKEKKWFRTAEVDVAGRECIPVELKVLAVLEVLGRGTFFDDVAKQSHMSIATAHSVFHRFCREFTLAMFDQWIALPTGDDLAKVMQVYDDLGFPGAMGSCDVTHLAWGCAPHSHPRSSTGKAEFPTLAYQAIVTHSGKVVGVTKGFPGSKRDKAIIRYDRNVQRIRESAVYTNVSYNLRNEDDAEVEHTGAYLIADGGYHKWKSLMSPTKAPLEQDEIEWCTMLAGVHKDVECFFGNLKGRFRILKLPIMYHKREDIDNMFFTCCILHNMLHTYDGLDVLEANVDWAGVDGRHNPWERNPMEDAGNLCFLEAPGEKVEVEAEHAKLKRNLITHFAYRARHETLHSLKL